jgi:hypothetical protein
LTFVNACSNSRGQVLVRRDQAIEQGDQLRPLFVRQRLQDAPPAPCPPSAHLPRRRGALGRDPERLRRGPPRRPRAAPAAAFSRPITEPKVAASKATLRASVTWSFAGRIQQRVEDGELHRVTSKPDRLLHEDRHRHLVRAPDQVAGRMPEIEALAHGASVGSDPCAAPD